MKQLNLNKTKLATTLSLILGATAVAPVFAAEEAEPKEANIEVIQVTGIRGSMVKSMDIKRSSTGIVDAINAEDIGRKLSRRTAWTVSMLNQSSTWFIQEADVGVK